VIKTYASTNSIASSRLTLAGSKANTNAESLLRTIAEMKEKEKETTQHTGEREQQTLTPKGDSIRPKQSDHKSDAPLNKTSTPKVTVPHGQQQKQTPPVNTPSYERSSP
jgi:predicted transcriptional regulator